MIDTPPHVQELFSQHIMAKSVAERFRMSFNMIDEGQQMMKRAIARQYPDYSEIERKVLLIERMYRDDFSSEEMARVKESYLDFIRDNYEPRP